MGLSVRGRCRLAHPPSDTFAVECQQPSRVNDRQLTGIVRPTRWGVFLGAAANLLPGETAGGGGRRERGDGSRDPRGDRRPPGEVSPGRLEALSPGGSPSWLARFPPQHLVEARWVRHYMWWHAKSRGPAGTPRTVLLPPANPRDYRCDWGGGCDLGSHYRIQTRLDDAKKGTRPTSPGGATGVAGTRAIPGGRTGGNGLQCVVAGLKGSWRRAGSTGRRSVGPMGRAPTFWGARLGSDRRPAACTPGPAWTVVGIRSPAPGWGGANPR